MAEIATDGESATLETLFRGNFCVISYKGKYWLSGVALIKPMLHMSQAQVRQQLGFRQVVRTNREST